MVKRYPINAPLKKVGLRPDFDIDSPNAESKVLRSIYNYVCFAKTDEIEATTRQIKGIINKKCRAELALKMMEEMGYETGLDCFRLF